MKSTRNITLLVVGILLLVLLAFLLPANRHNWRETYDPESGEPYGVTFLSRLLQTYFPGEEYQVLTDSFQHSLPVSGGDSARANYVFVGAAMHLRNSDVDRLLEFVRNGNQAVIAARVMPFNLMFHLYYEECDSLAWEELGISYDSSAFLNFKHPALREKQDFQYRFFERDQPVSYEWGYFEDAYFCDLEEGLAPIGTMNDSLVNFVRRPFGGGNFYLHSTPLAFTNYHLLNEANLAYVDKVFSHLQEGPIYWDEYSGVSERLGRAANERNGGGSRMISAESPLQFILSKPTLTWAWYLLLLTALLFMIFLSRRRQRIMPVLRKNTNTSLEFLTTIGNLYFLQNNNKQLALEKMQLFRNFVREKYQLQGLELDAEFKEKLGRRSEVEPGIIDKIILMHRNIKDAGFISENTLINFHKAMEQFYRHCR